MRFLLLACSTASPRTALLEQSLVEHHPDSQVITLVATPRLDGITHAGHLAYPHGLDFGGFRWEDLVLALGSGSAGWAALPWMIDELAPRWAESDSPLVVLDDTFFCSGPLTGGELAAQELAARARHVDRSGRAWGGYLPGFLVVGASADASADDPGTWSAWWRTRAGQHICNPQATDGPDPWWSLPEGTRVLADPALRLGAATATEIELDAEGNTAGGPPRLVDFDGLDPDGPWWIDLPGGRTAVDAAESPGLAALCEAHSTRLRESCAGRARRSSPMVALPGISVTPELRSWYRGLLAAAISSSTSSSTPGHLPPNPYIPGEAMAFIEVLASHGVGGRSGMGAHVDQLLERRDDLTSAFPSPRWKDRGAFGLWAWSHGLSEGETSLLTLPDPPLPVHRDRITHRRRPFGVNLVGYLDAELGLGVAARRMRAALSAAGVPVAEVSYDRTSSKRRGSSTSAMTTPYEFNLLLITPDQLPLFIDDVGADFLSGHHNIGLWYWESDVVAPSQAAAFELVDEIWVATRYLTRAFEGHGKPLSVIPSPLVFDEPPPENRSRGRHGLDDRFTFLFSFDFLSVSERKNPIGLIDAYVRAFPDPHGGTRLLLKSINGRLFPEDLAHLRRAASSRPDITVRDENLDALDRLGLIAAADCYVSLHRSEGLGLTMAEAMALGTPVIATAYAGNLDFMPDGSVLTVPATEEPVGPGHYYPAHGHWASPDLDVAAAHMRRVSVDGELRARLAAGGRSALEEFSYDRVGQSAVAALLRAWEDL